MPPFYYNAPPLDLRLMVLGCFAILGHAFLWVALVNRIHGAGLPRWLVKSISLIFYALFWTLLGGGAWLAWQVVGGQGLRLKSSAEFAPAATTFFWRYYYFCVFPGLGIAVHWLGRKLTRRTPMVVLASSATLLDIGSQLNASLLRGVRGKLLGCVPGNQIVTLAVEQIDLAARRLPAALDGWSIAHLSDLHITGQVDRRYFEELVRQTNALQADLIAITGDLFDRADCLSWIPDTLGRLAAPQGVYFVLGNHDLRTHDVPRVRRELAAAGLIDLGGRCRELAVGEARVFLAGNELPWLKPAPDTIGWPDRAAEPNQFRLLLSHAPDQIQWARTHDFDLMLAGHTHGGQIRFPVIGPIVAPSRYGVRYASGTFELPPTTMHVSRGSSGKFLLRLNCPCELAHLRLHRAADLAVR